MSLIKGTIGTLAAISLLYGFYETGYKRGLNFGREEGKRVMYQRAEKTINEMKYQLVTGVDGVIKSSYSSAKASLEAALREPIEEGN